MADKFIEILQGDAQKRLKDMGDGTHAEVVAVVGATAGGGSSEILVTSYTVAIAFAGGSVGNLVTLTEIFNFAQNPPVITAIWRNETTNTVLSSAPPNNNLSLIGGGDGLTDGQLRAAPVAITAASLPLPTGAATEPQINTLTASVGLPNDSVATSDTGTFSLNALFKRALQNFTTLLARIPTLGQKAMTGSIPVSLASDQSTVPISAVSLPLPTGAATEPQLNTLTASVGLPNDSVATSDTGTFSLNALFKRALQDFTSLLARIPTLGQKAMSGSIPVAIASDQGNITTVTGDSGQTVSVGILRTTGNSSISSARYFCAQNVGAGGGAVNGVTLNPGEKVEFTAPPGYRLPVIIWAAAGGPTTLLITYLQ